MNDRDQVGGIVLWFYLLNPLEILASEAGHFGGYLVVPQPSEGLLEPYYFVCCQLDRKRCVMILPRVRDRQTIICSVPEPGLQWPLRQTLVPALPVKLPPIPGPSRVSSQFRPAPQNL